MTTILSLKYIKQFVSYDSTQECKIWYKLVELMWYILCKKIHVCESTNWGTSITDWMTMVSGKFINVLHIMIKSLKLVTLYMVSFCMKIQVIIKFYSKNTCR